MAILYGTQSNGETLPVLVDQFGNLLAKGIEGPPGPEGPPGVGELPPGATDGALLGWQDGELVWITEPLPPVIVAGFRPFIYTGNGGTQSIDCGFSPDFVWIKDRTTNESHALFDTLRGDTNLIYSNTTNIENSQSTTLTSFDSDGFTVGSDGKVNTNNDNYVAWCWDAGDTTVTNNEGTIPSQVRSNGSFSIVKYTGNGSVASVGHGLETAPSMFIVKSTSDAFSWFVYHESINNGQQLKLNSADAKGSTGYWQNTNPSSSVIYLDGSENNEVAGDGKEFIAYCWSETASESSFGQYTGNSGRQTIQIGFKPSLVIIKSTGTGDWFMFDNARGASNALYPNLNAIEADTGAIEFLDTGFQILFGLPGVSENDQTYIYAAFANPEDAAFARMQLRRQVRQEERQQNETRLR